MTEKNKSELTESLKHQENSDELYEILEDNPEIVRELSTIMISKGVFSGPLPPPETLEGYKRIQNDFPERIMAMAEEQSKHRQDLEKKVIESNIINERRGQIFGFIIFVLGLLIGAFLLYKDKTIAGLTSFIGVLVSGVAIFISERIIVKKSIEKKDSELINNEPVSDEDL